MDIKSRSIQKAFTLIELLIVIAIIGILTVAFLPVLRGGQNKARDAAKKSLVNNLVITFENKINEGSWSLPSNVAPATGDCLTTWTRANPEAAIASALGRVPESWPAITSTGTHLCSGSNIYYKKFAVTDSYMLAVEVENSSNANAEVNDGSQIQSNAAVADVLADTDGAVPGTGPWFYVVGK